MKKNDISAAKFDAVFDPADVIWGADAIGGVINRSGDYVRDTLVKLPGSPVRKAGRRYYVERAALEKFLFASH